MMRNFGKWFVLLGIIGLLAGCGGVVSDNERDNSGVNPDSLVNMADAIPVRILKAENKTGDPKYDNLCQFLHIKAAQVLSEQGQFVVVSDAVLEGWGDFVNGDEVTPEIQFRIKIKKVQESSGGTLKFVIFSAQQKRAIVELEVTAVDKDGSETIQQFSGTSTKGAWGVLASVNRQSMLDNKEFWKLDDSMVGIAGSRALQKFNLFRRDE